MKVPFRIVLFMTRKCGDMIFCDSNFQMKYLTLVSSTLSTRIIVNTITPQKYPRVLLYVPGIN